MHPIPTLPLQKGKGKCVGVKSNLYTPLSPVVLDGGKGLGDRGNARGEVETS
jgi:hypothetical protein